MSAQENFNYEVSDQELFSEREESDYEERPVSTYKKYKKSGSMAKCVVLQTSDSSDDENFHRTQASALFYTKARKDAAAAKARTPLATLVSRTTGNRKVPPPKKMMPTTAVESMKQSNLTSQIPNTSTSKSSKQPTESHTHPSGENQTLKELQKTNELLVLLVGRIKKTEQCVRNLEDKSVTTSTPSSSSGSTPKRLQSRRKAVPQEVRVRIVCLYSMVVCGTYTCT